MTERECDCGGLMRLDYYDPVVRPVEWFLRCHLCGATTESRPTPEAVIGGINNHQADAA